MVKQVVHALTLFSLLVLLTSLDASLIRTTTEGTCSKTPQSRDLKKCINYVKEAASSGGYGGGGRVNTNDIFACCTQIKVVEPDCVCSALKKVIRESQKQGQFKEEDVSRMTRRARNIPNMCRMGPQGCDWSSVSTDLGKF